MQLLKTYHNRDNNVTYLTLVWTCKENEENTIPKSVFYMNLEITSPRGRPRNTWQDEVREVGRLAGGEEWQEIVCNRQEWK
jgi:hypothetical protein